VAALIVLAVVAGAAALLSRRDPKIRRVRVGLFVERERFNNDERNDGDDHEE
jgi:hypothetical protein